MTRERYFDIHSILRLILFDENKKIHYYTFKQIL